MVTTPSTSNFIPSSGQPMALPQPSLAKTTFVPTVNLVDPITSKRLKLDSPFNDKLLVLTPKQKMKLGLYNTFVTLPQTVRQGLRGSSRFTFSDFLHVANIPYYLGGGFLALSFAAGRDKVNFVRQALGVGLYYLGVMGANAGINRLYKWKSGVDLNLRYQKPNGDIEKVFASTNFPRFDLLTESHYRTMGRKMGIPDNIADPHREIEEQTRRVISSARTDKLVLGNLLAAVGAGYLARSNAWARVLGGNGVLKAIWTDPKAGGLGQRLKNTQAAISGILGKGIQEKITGFAGERAPWLRRGVLGLTLMGTAGILYHVLTVNNRRRAYESPLITALAPEMNPDYTPAEPSERGLSRRAVFSMFEQERANATLSGRASRP